jgi:hypothetical protein
MREPRRGGPPQVAHMRAHDAPGFDPHLRAAAVGAPGPAADAVEAEPALEGLEVVEYVGRAEVEQRPQLLEGVLQGGANGQGGVWCGVVWCGVVWSECARWHVWQANRQPRSEA